MTGWRTNMEVFLCIGKIGDIGEDEKAQMELLQQPEDIIRAVHDSKVTGEQSEIHHILKNRKINLRNSIEEENTGKRTIFKKLLEDCVNGDKIIEKELDRLIEAPMGVSENSVEYAINIDMSGILKGDSPRQTKVIRDLLDLRAKHKDHCDEGLTNLIMHPVITMFILEKWKKVKFYFYLTSFMFFLFLMAYSGFIIYLFSRPEVPCTQGEKAYETSLQYVQYAQQKLLPEEGLSCQKHKANHSEVFLTEWNNGFSVVELLFLILTSLLTVYEVYQVVVLRLQYLRELENFIEWIVLISAFITMVFKHNLLQVGEGPSSIRGIASIGICFAWLELIFIIGRYPFRGGDFSIMFYNIIKKIARYVLAMLLMLIGFAFAFHIVHYQVENESFESAFKSFMVTLTMALGEFNLDDFYNNFKKDDSSRAFAMILLILLVLFVTITMVNLFIAVIISDIAKMKKEVYIQKLVNMAQYSILVEKFLPHCILSKMRVPEPVQVCVHSLCSEDCKGERLPANYKTVEEALKKIVQKKTPQGEEDVYLKLM